MASNLLWAHLLRKDVTTTESFSQIPPIVPQDKTGTSIRMLIHDTQVNLEKFSTRLDGLLQRVDDSRAQVVNANKLLDVERDKVLTEILEIANRCQSELKAHVGTPAQAPAIDLVRIAQVSIEKSLQASEKRIDALQALLQTQAHAMQSIQDQQNTLIGAVLPLLPVIHGFPSQIDQIKTALSDMTTNTVSMMTNSVEDVRSMLVAEFAHRHGGVGSSPRVVSPGKSMSRSRRRRSNALELGTQEISASVSLPLDGRDHGEAHANIKRARVEGATRHTGNVHLPRKMTRLTVPLVNSGESPHLLQTPRTPRQPLADLLLPPGCNTPMVQHRLASHVSLTSRGYMRPPEILPVAGSSSTIPTSKSRPPLRPFEHAHSDSQGPTITRRRSAALHDVPLAVDKFAVGLPSAAGPLDQDDILKVIKTEEILEPNLTGAFSIHSSPLSSPPSSVSLATHRNPKGASTNMDQPSTQQHIRRRDGMPEAPLVELVQVLPSPFPGPFSSSPPRSMSLRDRRAQISRFGRSETRRFISLVPWSDEEE